MKRLLWLLEVLLFIAFSFPIAILPYKISLRVGDLLGSLLFYLWGSRRKIAIENIEQSVKTGALNIAESPYLIAKESFMNLGRSFVELAKIYYGLGENIVNDVEIEGLENYRVARAKNKGAILITGHCSNWELTAIAFGVKVEEANGVARRQNNPYLDRIVERVRARYVNKIIYKKGALKGILSVLRGNRVVGILMDQAVVKEEGFIVDFLGRGAWTTRTPATIARKTGSPVLPVFIHRTGDRYMITIDREVLLSQNEDTEEAIKEDTLKFNAAIGDWIKKYPSQWLWIHRRWKRVN